jgi:hypothetical protein
VTEKGQEIYEEAMNLSAFNTIISSLPPEDMQRFKQSLNVLQEAADKLLASK